ncbi:MAG: ribonuclease Z [Candidatus Methanoplasma sp.]|jgi:ribonuclease Z|nr:ribonuclease Z [Candidatus Methanoplasma sp.]
MLEILFLGTGASVPSRESAPSCIAVRCGREIALFDCGEGSQRQLMVSPFSFMKISCIFITHMHGDHVLGLPGLVQTMSMSGRSEPLTVCGPPGIRGFLDAVSDACEGRASYPLEIIEAEPGFEARFEGFSVSAFETDHGVRSLGFALREHPRRGRFDRARAVALGVRPGPDFSRLQNGESVGSVSPADVMGEPQPGLSVVYSGDTLPCDGVRSAAMGADVLIHEATYSARDAGLAASHGHSTAEQAAEIARGCGCGALLLTHVSNRYDDRSEIEEEARRVFPESRAARDMDLFAVSADGLRSA